MLTNLNLPTGQNIYIRARGFYRTGENGSELAQEIVRNAFLLGPTAATVSIAGRVLTPNGRGLSNAVVSLTETNGNIRTARTGAFGYYRFDEVEVGQTCVFSVSSKRFQFTPQVITINENLEKLDFIAEW